jgi:hypothetical protein
VAAEHGLVGVEPVVLRDRANLLLHLTPAPVVARVATTTALVRPGVAENLARDVAIAGYLAQAGAPVVPPSDDPPAGPHRRDGYTFTFWRYVEHEPDHRFAPAEFAGLLAELHPVLADYPGELPDRPPIDTPGLLAHLDLPAGERAALAAAADRVVAEVIAAGLPVQALHGDAHPGNVLCTPAGPLWNDFEDTWRGPIAWDLACLAGTGRLDGIAALAAYPGSPTLADLGAPLAARRMQVRLWTLLMRQRFPEPAGGHG